MNVLPIQKTIQIVYIILFILYARADAERDWQSAISDSQC